MSRRIRATEVSGEVIVPQRGGQYMHHNKLCATCHGVNMHYPECDYPLVYAIPSSAEVPAKKSSKRKWEIFLQQWVFGKPKGFWFHRDGCWWENEKSPRYSMIMFGRRINPCG